MIARGGIGFFGSATRLQAQFPGFEIFLIPAHSWQNVLNVWLKSGLIVRTDERTSTVDKLLIRVFETAVNLRRFLGFRNGRPRAIRDIYNRMRDLSDKLTFGIQFVSEVCRGNRGH
jgi:hypothetical protein